MWPAVHPAANRIRGSEGGGRGGTSVRVSDLKQVTDDAVDHTSTVSFL